MSLGLVEPPNIQMAGPSSVQALVLHGEKDLRIVGPLSGTEDSLRARLIEKSKESRPLPPPAATELQIAIRCTGLCGSDLHYYHHYRNGDILVKEPLILGHECAGVVVAVGAEVTDFEIGEKVALEVGQPCGDCDRCREGRYNICKGMRFRSSAKSFPHYQGTLQGRINHPAAWCHKSVFSFGHSLSLFEPSMLRHYRAPRLPKNVSLDLGAILEPLAVAIHAARRAQIALNSTVLVFGAGAVGLLCAATAKASGSSHVTIADIDKGRVSFATRNKFAHAGFVVPMKRGQTIDEKLEIAKDIAALAARAEGAQGEPVGEVDLVFECTGVESCLQAAIYVPLLRFLCHKQAADHCSPLDQVGESCSLAWARQSRLFLYQRRRCGRWISWVFSDTRTRIRKESISF